MTGCRASRTRAAGAAAAIALLLAGCAGPRSDATTNDVSGCAAVLPLARDVVHGHGTLTAIRKISRADLETLTREVGATPPPPTVRHPPRPPVANPPRDAANPTGPALPKTCLIVYQGHYPPGAVTGASPPAVAGDYALIVLRVRHPEVTRVLDPDGAAHRPARDGPEAAPGQSTAGSVDRGINRPRRAAPASHPASPPRW